jgi:hypothetical protein
MHVAKGTRHVGIDGSAFSQPVGDTPKAVTDIPCAQLGGFIDVGGGDRAFAKWLHGAGH